MELQFPHWWQKLGEKNLEPPMKQTSTETRPTVVKFSTYKHLSRQMSMTVGAAWATVDFKWSQSARAREGASGTLNSAPPNGSNNSS